MTQAAALELRQIKQTHKALVHWDIRLLQAHLFPERVRDVNDPNYMKLSGLKRLEEADAYAIARRLHS